MFLMRRLLSILIIIVIFIYMLIPYQTIIAKTKYSEILILYKDDNDITFIVSQGCVLERIYSVFDIVLALCPYESIPKLNSYNLYTVPNFNVSIHSTLASFKTYMHINEISNDAGSTNAWSWAISRVSADIVWQLLNNTGRGVNIAILDTGIDPYHPLLIGKLSAWIEFDRKGNPVCSKPHDTHGHGTWVSSIAVGGDATRYRFGVAPDAKIMVALVLPGGYGTAAQILAGLEWVLKPYDCNGRPLNISKPDVVSMSFGSESNYTNIFLPAIRKLIENGIIPVAAIGNSGPYSSANPGNIWGVIGVGAIDKDNSLAWFSSYEYVEWPEPPSDWPFKGEYPSVYRKPDVVAPGVDIPGAFPGGLIAIGSGTSASTPIVAGIAGILSEILKSKGYYGSSLVEKVYDILTSTASPLPYNGSGYGLIDAFLATSKALGRSINIIDLKFSPSVARPLSSINIYPQNLDVSKEVLIFLSGINVYKGPYVRNTVITISIPPTHIGGNTLIFVDKDGTLYNRTIVIVTPALILSNRTAIPGRNISILISGIGIGDLIVLYLGNNILTLDFADLRGTYLANLLIPYVEKGNYNLTLVDLSTPSIVLRDSISILPLNYSRTVVINNTYITKIYNPSINIFSILVKTKDYYTIKRIDYFDISISSNINITNISINLIRPLDIEFKVLNISKILPQLYRVWFYINNITSESRDIIISIEVSTNNGTITYPMTLTVKSRDIIADIDSTTSQAMTRISILNTTLNNALNLINDITLNITKMNRDISYIYTKYQEQEKSLSSIISNISRGIENVNSLSKRIENLTIISTILFIATLIMLLTTYITIVRRRK
ncbi:peptidase S8 and S53 subtilisin kexin sedolisin [Ignisphaera aggregans DSM 17230]|uniref:Peptidase S8 and S53 subtilisin kexin sedolisin n=1 Tax=Ignisphaera aggregans (strain DSM 17230 / JCM 13409 / AQ1.S1) TaxID=583356 RepID=E0SQN3_IGNAA|nr:peptidase S8 and S53 subtilisin kexin sedolisin [Ignisphaera aggregans DSM 17230]